MEQQAEENTIHHELAKSYLAYFVASMAGLLVDSFLHISFDVPYAKTVGIVLMGLGPLLMLWAQLTSAKGHAKPASRFVQYFEYGPYRFVRNPTHLGILLLVTGYTLISGSVVFFATTFIGFVVSNIFFGKYESLMHQSFGDAYTKVKETTPKV